MKPPRELKQLLMTMAERVTSVLVLSIEIIGVYVVDLTNPQYVTSLTSYYTYSDHQMFSENIKLRTPVTG